MSDPHDPYAQPDPGVEPLAPGEPVGPGAASGHGAAGDPYAPDEQGVAGDPHAQGEQGGESFEFHSTAWNSRAERASGRSAAKTSSSTSAACPC